MQIGITNDLSNSDKNCQLVFWLFWLVGYFISGGPNLSVNAVISLDTLGEEDTESMMMLETTEDQGGDDGHSMVIIGPQGPPGRESPTAQTPKRSPPSYNTHGGLRKKRRGASGQSKPLPNKQQDLQVVMTWMHKVKVVEILKVIPKQFDTEGYYLF